MTKSAGNCGFGRIYAFTEEILNGKFHFLCSENRVGLSSCENPVGLSMYEGHIRTFGRILKNCRDALPLYRVD